MVNSYIRTDLASESRQDVKDSLLTGVKSSQHAECGVTVSQIEICDEEAQKILQKPMGNYVTLSFESVCTMDAERRAQIALLLAEQLRCMLKVLCPDLKKVFVAGLGNRRITADALGPMTTDRITVTQHLLKLDPSLFRQVGQLSVSALAPGVLGDTGIEAAILVGRAAEAAMPDAVIVVDALAARSVDRLGCTVQLSDAGIAPGSGVGNSRMALTKQTMGVPVIAVGVPTVVHSATLVRDALSNAGIDEISPALEQVLQNGDGFFVTQKECDMILEAFSEILSQAIDSALACDIELTGK